MGEYWKPVNVTRKEYVHPHHMDCGLKLPEWNWAGSRVRKLIDAEWSPNDDVRAVSDYGSELQLWGEPGDETPTYGDLDDYAELKGRD